ncbi:hypothetical protein [Isoptericola sp. BMS4]|uniref:hypothetical protein n=1 Tax=Isoptericola sp. BMS4 TaxID=2527875 RepID=UPI001423EFE9|nr:hypothetical protein [Isoptericola sp. BMS4]
MLQRILGGVLVLLGLVSVALGVASATVWRDSDTVVATARPAGDGTMVVTDPGVLGLVSDDVTVTASVPDGQKVTLVVGRDVDVDGWVGQEPSSRVTGLSDWETLAVEQGAPEPEGEGDEPAEPVKPSGADPAGSDMWVAEASDSGGVTLRWSDRPGRWTLLAAGVGDEAQAPSLTFTWPRAVTTPYLWPAVGAGAALVLVGLVLLVLGFRKPRRRRRAAARAAGGDETTTTAAEPEGTADSSETGTATLFGPVRGRGTADAGPAAPPWTPPEAPGGDRDAGPADAQGPGPASGQDAPEDGAELPVAGPAVVPGDESRTAEVPVAGRLLRRSRRRAAPVAPPAGTDAVAVPTPAPPTPEDRPATGSVPRMTRRELRAQEEARRAAEQGGVSRMLRAMTGSIPVVRQHGAPEGSKDDAAGPDLSTPAGRAAAWRATWGFGQTADRTGSSGDRPGHDSTDGENR